jgi:hypothetical protein
MKDKKDAEREAGEGRNLFVRVSVMTTLLPHAHAMYSGCRTSQEARRRRKKGRR